MHQMFAERMDLLPDPVPGDLACLGGALGFCKQGATLCCSGGPCSEPTFLVCTWRRCLLSGLGDCVSDLLEILILIEGVFSLWIEGAPSVLQELLNSAPPEQGPGMACQGPGPPVSSRSHVSGFTKLDLSLDFCPRSGWVITNFLVSSQFLK